MFVYESDVPTTLYYKIEQEIKKWIIEGRYKTGELIPSETELQKIFNASRLTIREAVKHLAAQGLLEKKQGVGTYIRRPIIEHRRGFLYSPSEEILARNFALVTEVIQPALESGNVVICDRYADSTTAYQGYGRRLDLPTVAAVNDLGKLGLTPDLTILLDMPVEDGLARKQDRKQDRFESENIVFHRRVREGYHKLAEAEPERWFVVDAAQSREKIAGIIWQKVSQMISGQG